MKESKICYIGPDGKNYYGPNAFEEAKQICEQMQRLISPITKKEYPSNGEAMNAAEQDFWEKQINSKQKK